MGIDNFLIYKILTEIDRKQGKIDSNDIKINGYSTEKIINEIEILYLDKSIDGKDTTDKDEKSWIALKLTSKGRKLLEEIKSSLAKNINAEELDSIISKLESIKKILPSFKKTPEWYQGYDEIFPFYNIYCKIRERLQLSFTTIFNDLSDFQIPKPNRSMVVGNPDYIKASDIYVFQRDIFYVNELLKKLIKNKKSKKVSSDSAKKKIFIVHGHDEKLTQQLEIFLIELDLDCIVLHRKPDEGRTVIEKFEEYGKEAGYAFILLTPDDVSYSVEEETKEDKDRMKEKIARQNVIFEFGYFVGKLGRNRVCCLYKEGVTLPTDISGVLYKPIKENVEEKSFEIQKELKAAGIKFKISSK